ncbi:MAG: hypothetical protein UU56_C0001G0005 [Candidatus Curtissbacteria bacterium GW2011_GWA2_41_24]|uniref:Uncharacterized protein n=1 Tax=Candidatus Curtissbacteria bacterium GW2011_GWA2_41_24 TaxID=1618411 RepID=A0A0G0YX29_9BACT|nr:MAG: hypothetical protein UU56_C0001G0005 [Candidatus Curtissbacteria bacterium GW2011_GWA2_41_24]
MAKRRKFTKEETKNLVDLMHALRDAFEDQKHLTQKEKKDNAIKMGDIYY